MSGLASAFIQVYNDQAHTSEVTHTANVSTDLNGAVLAGATTITVDVVTGMPAAGVVDIDSGGAHPETIPYVNITGNVLTLADALGFNHADEATVVQWYYLFNIPSNLAGIPNDGTQSTCATAPTVSFWYWNSGNQSAQNTVLSIQNVSPTTPQGFTDTTASVTSATTGCSQSISIGTVTAQTANAIAFWVDEQVPSGQSGVGNPQIGVVQFAYQSI